MELISKEVVKRIIDSERTREQMLEMVESAVAVDSSTDCISREAVFNVLRTMYDTHIIETEDGDEYIDYNDTIYEIEELPSVKPKERVGHWIAVYQGDEIINYRCAECEFGNTFGKNTDGMYYCPNCGAKMIERIDWREYDKRRSI